MIQPRIKDTERRAGRAPYNFVPLPEHARLLTGEELPVRREPGAAGKIVERGNLDRYEGLSGYLDIELAALTDFYIRGMWDMASYQKAPDGKASPQPEPFRVASQLRLPGSSLRGLFRWLVEVLGESPLHPVNDSQLFFRAVGATDRPDARNPNSFEPQAISYKQRVRKEEEAKLAGSDVFVRAGYLHGSRDGWHIKPARKVMGRQWHQIRYDPGALTKEFCGFRILENFWFRPSGSAGGGAYAETQQSPALPGPGWHEAVYVASGFIQKKRVQWIIHGEDTKADPVPIPREDVEAYKESGVSKAITNWQFAYGDDSKNIPCFYVEWNDLNGERHVSFGHTHYFRLPYQRTIQQAVPPLCRQKPGEWDLAMAMFGRSPDEHSSTGLRGRVFFEDAFLMKAPTIAFEPRAVRAVLGSPKPTTYQHYLRQPSERVEDAIHWDGDLKCRAVPVPEVRGHKAYFHRPKARLPLGGTERTATLLQPAKANCVFQARIRFENLQEWELGALLTALELPAECAHRLGMAKPHGFGSFRVKVLGLSEIARAKRYSSLVDEAGRLNLGAEDGMGRREELKKVFRSRFYCGTDPWTQERIKELRALLTFDGLPANWLNRTRYLEFGKLPEGRMYNEYQQVGYPNRVEMQKRRPLPPATQVLKDANLPSDPRPPLGLGGRE